MNEFQGYNYVQNWHYNQLPEAFGAEKGSYDTYTVKTRKELEDLFKNEKFCSAPHLQVDSRHLSRITTADHIAQFVELYMPKGDAPLALQSTARASAENNAKES